MATVCLRINGREILSFRSKMDSELSNIISAVERARKLGHDLKVSDMGKTFEIAIY